jgi:hypothetical protein
MKKLLLLFTILCLTRSLSAQNHIPDWYLQVFKKADLNKTYSISSYIKPTNLLSDFNGGKLLIWHCWLLTRSLKSEEY